MNHSDFCKEACGITGNGNQYHNNIFNLAVAIDTPVELEI